MSIFLYRIKQPIKLLETDEYFIQTESDPCNWCFHVIKMLDGTATF